jgi:hypothetical protein
MTRIFPATCESVDRPHGRRPEGYEAEGHQSRDAL